MDVMDMRRRLLMMQRAPAKDYALIHRYIYGSAPYDFGGGVVGFKDAVGDYDLHTGHGVSTHIKGDTSDTDAARSSWGIYPGDAWKIEATGLTRSTRYPGAQGVNLMLSGTNGQNLKSLGRGSQNRIYAVVQGGPTSAPQAVPIALRYYRGSTDTRVESTGSFMAMNADPCTITVTYESGVCILYVDGAEALRFEDADSAALYHIDGIDMNMSYLVTNHYWHFEEISVYKK